VPHRVGVAWLVVSAERCFGGYSGGETPGLIPNPEAKPSSADGTALGRVWESRTPPDSTYSRGPSPTGVGPRLLLCVQRLVALDGRSARCASRTPVTQQRRWARSGDTAMAARGGDTEMGGCVVATPRGCPGGDTAADGCVVATPRTPSARGGWHRRYPVRGGDAARTRHMVVVLRTVGALRSFGRGYPGGRGGSIAGGSSW
jgi:hypothetical protein